MEKLITDFLDQAAESCPNKTAFVEPNNSITYSELRKQSLAIAKAITERGLFKEPVAILMDKSIACIESFLGVAYSGNFYSLIDVDMPEARALKIIEVLKPKLVLTDKKKEEQAKRISAKAKVLTIEALFEEYEDKEIALDIRDRLLSSDVLYVLFTSGSTGVPKGVITSHRAVISYTYAVKDAYRICEDAIIGNQVPFYFVMSIFDIYETIARKAQLHIIPRKYYAFPGLLVKYLQDNKINTIDWVPSALALVANVNGFDAADLSSIRTVIFGGEVMPIKHLRAWQKALPNAAFFNGYGSTEVTEAAVFYELNRDFKDGDILPIGKPYNNTEVLVLNEHDELVTEGIGELCVRGDSLSYGYYGDIERTNEVFVQNPLNSNYKDIIYRTGDLVQYNKYDEIEYIGRKDAQIKHMGRRIELGEIEANISAIKGIKENCCLYNKEHQQIVAYYSGDIEEGQLGTALKSLLPTYMLPAKRIQLDSLPHNLNGKIDRAALREKEMKAYK